MSRVHPVFHVSLLKRPKDGGRHSAPPPAMLLDGHEECEIDKVLSHRSKPHKRQLNHREYLVSWKGMGPEDREWLSENKLSNAADLVQDYLQGLQASDRSAPRVGKASTDVPAGVSTPPQSGTTSSSNKKPGRPVKAGKQPGLAQSGVRKRRSERLRKRH
ncbi:hypothetical protein ABBQ32_008897 [Trebouxia sp. C0010 RCD-2024]